MWTTKYWNWLGNVPECRFAAVGIGCEESDMSGQVRRTKRTKRTNGGGRVAFVVVAVVAVFVVRFRLLWSHSILKKIPERKSSPISPKF